MRIGTINIEKPLFLAPMDGVTDRPFRIMCKEQGADILCTEFVSCEALVRGIKRILKKIELTDAERPIGIQMYGGNEANMERAAGVVESFNPDYIDLNAGCWVRKVVFREEGAGLLKNLQRFEGVLRAVIRGTKLPVTVKTRLGWDRDNIVILEVARMVEQCGAQALTLHCRTRDQAFRGKADWSWLEKVRSVISIPLIGNGDVCTADDARQMFDMGCDGVMIGRAAIRNFQVFAEIARGLATGERPPEPSLAERVAICIRHLQASVEGKGERRGVLEFRKHYAGYLKNTQYAARVRAELMQFTELAPIVERLQEFVRESEQEEKIFPADATPTCSTGSTRRKNHPSS